MNQVTKTQWWCAFLVICTALIIEHIYDGTIKISSMFSGFLVFFCYRGIFATWTDLFSPRRVTLTVRQPGEDDAVGS